MCLASALLLAVATAACGDDNRTNADIAVDEGQGRGEDLAAQANLEFADDLASTIIAKSGAIALAIDEGVIEQADLLLQLGATPAVIQYAEDMLAEHSDHLVATLDLLDTYDLVPIDNPIAATIRTHVVTGLRQIESSSDVDLQYMLTQVSIHQEAFIVVAELFDLAPDDVTAVFFSDMQVMLLEHRTNAELLARGLE